MQLHQLKSNSQKKRKRVGRGGAHGTTATRGTKGQKSRSGSGRGPSFEGNAVPLFRRTPKLRGFKSLKPKNFAVNLTVVEKLFENGETVSPSTLWTKGAIKNNKNTVKILGSGEIKKKVIFEDCLVSQAAQEKINKAGGEIKAILEK